MLSVRYYLRAYVNTGAAIKGVTCSARQLLVWRNGSHLSLTSYRKKTEKKEERFADLSRLAKANTLHYEIGNVCREIHCSVMVREEYSRQNQSKPD
jgi:hypothetical protein